MIWGMSSPKPLPKPKLPILCIILWVKMGLVLILTIYLWSLANGSEETKEVLPHLPLTILILGFLYLIPIAGLSQLIGFVGKSAHYGKVQAELQQKQVSLLQKIPKDFAEQLPEPQPQPLKTTGPAALDPNSLATPIYYFDENPMNLAEAKLHIISNQLPPETPAWKEGDPEWLTIGDYAELQ